MRFHVDGRLVDAADATLPVADRGVTAGDAVTEPVRVADGSPVAWTAHADRLRDACAALEFGVTPDAADLRARVDETVAANDHDDALVRVRVTRGRGGGASTLPDAARLRPPADPDPTVVVTLEPLTVERDPIRLQTVRARAIRPAAVPVAPATHNRLDAVRAQAELRRAAPPDDDPADEALVLTDDGHVVGGTASDPLFVAGDALRLPALGEWPARTATRRLVRDLAAAEGLPVAEGAYTPADVRAADEVFVAEPTAGVRPVDRIDGVAVDDGPVTRLLAHLYDARFVDGDA
ncbi:aminodeoxychorismate lyase [Haloplanus rubicundus]|uniref:Aminodeoxychorismate lyase n=1 Tax=Haloplanus rubicundus TaxID=1547898 RepID=A0A345E3A5_9EURY|nr:aminotransferase class IV [Haloplanus rubicundus]AXG06677.1 aminodeoxychorismate lyase [Haloplanus rubicundus]